MRNDLDMCMWCGRNPAEDEHHLFRRSTSPGLIDDPKNKVRLCRVCHKYATEQKEVEERFQQYFFLKPEEENLTVAYVAEKMKNESVLSPRDIARFRNYLAAEYSFLSSRFEDLERQMPFKIEQYRVKEGIKSDARAERLYLITEEGQAWTVLKLQMKAVEKMLSALKTCFEVLIKEGMNIF